MKSLSPFTLIVTFVCLALVGLALVPMLPVKLNPSRTLPGFTVRFSMPGTSSRVVEMEATSKLESMLARIKGVKGMYSTSSNGYGSITVDLDKHADVDAVRFEASTIIRQTWSQLPSGVSYPYIDMKVPDANTARPFLSFTLNAPSTPILIQQYAEEHIKPRLAKLQGIYKIDLSGATPMEWRLEYDSEQLRTLGISISDIQRAIQLHYNKEFLGTHNMDTAGGKQWIRLVLIPDGVSGQFIPSDITVTASDGALAVGASREKQALMRKFGESIGMAFQIQDDILDYTRTARTGKPSNNDLREHKVTLPLLTVLESVGEERRRELLARLARCHEEDESVEYLQHIVENEGGMEKAARVMQEYLTRAMSVLSEYEPSEYRDALANLCVYVGERDR